jgi:hypothetical protein
MNNRLTLVLGLAISGIAGHASAADVAPAGFLVRYELAVGAPPVKVYASLINVGSWWSEKHTYSGDSEISPSTLARAASVASCPEVSNR